MSFNLLKSYLEYDKVYSIMFRVVVFLLFWE